MGNRTSVSDGDSPFVSVLTQRDCPHLTHNTDQHKEWYRYMRRQKRNKIIKRAFIITAAVALVLLFILVLTNVSGLSVKKKELDTKISELNQAIKEQNEKTQRLEEYREYTKTREFTEEVARDQLGLVYPGEIVLRAQ